MGLWLNECLIANLEKLDTAVEDLARSGYGVIRVMLRHTNYNHRSPQVVAAVGRIVEMAHAFRLKVVLDCEPHKEPVAHDAGALFPDAIGVRIARVEAEVVQGRFCAHLASPASLSQRADFIGIEAVFLREGSTYRKLDGIPSLKHRVVTEPYRNGFTTGSHLYVEGRPCQHESYVHLSGTIPEVDRGQLVIYGRFFDPRTIDFWSKGIRDYYDLMLEAYRSIPLDGVGWDEPGTGGDWSHYLFGDSFAKEFERSNGYRLQDKWALMDAEEFSAESMTVRLDYYRTFNEGIFRAQEYFIRRARHYFGDKLILGTHHTWQGEGGINDYRSGDVDYFRLNDNMDAGYTDCWWWDPKSVSYAYTLGSSLGRVTASGKAEINTWDAKPTNTRVEFQARLMTLMNLTWFNIWYGEATDTCLYPADYTWETTVREMKRHGTDQRRIGRAKPVIDVAILHGWETVCAINRADIAGAHKTCCMNTAKLFSDRNVAFDWVDTRLLADSQIEDGRLVNALGKYSVLILPYASILPREAWKQCCAFVSAGGGVIFTGTPPERDVEGAALNAEFANLLNMPELPLETYLAAVDAICTLPQHRPDQLDICVELEGDPGAIVTSIEGERHGMQNEEGNLIYLSDLDPRERLLDIIEPWLNTDVTCYSDSILWRLYRDGEREFLVCIAREGRTLNGLIRWDGEEMEFRSGKVVFWDKKSGPPKVYERGSELEATANLRDGALLP